MRRILVLLVCTCLGACEGNGSDGDAGTEGATSTGSTGAGGSTVAAESTGAQTGSQTTGEDSTGSSETGMPADSSSGGTTGPGESSSGGGVGVCDPTHPDNDNECYSCVAPACCDAWTACRSDEACRCLIDCQVIDGNSMGSCKGTCNSTEDTEAAYNAVFFCGQQSCLNTCDWSVA